MNAFATPEVLYAIADEIGVPNEFITVERAIDDYIWFRTKAGATYSARTVCDGKRLKKHSVRRD
jgi:hypothetical protein